ncbi:hypothetical protein COFR110785_11235 [Corynebacterium frankenforstense]
MQVAQGRERPVEQADPPVAQRAVAEPQHDEPAGEHQQPRRAHPPGHAAQPDEPRGGHGEGDDHEDGLADQREAGAAFGVDEGGPAGGPAQDLRRVEPAGGHPGGLDEVGERRRVPAEHQQRDQPPEADQHRSRRPRRRGGAQTATRCGVVNQAPQQHHRAGHAGGECRGGVDRAHQRDGQGGGRARAPAGAAEQREDHPGGEHDRPGLRRDRGQRRQHARGGDEGDGAGDLRGRAAHTQPAQQGEHAGVADGEHEQPPGALGEPVGQPVGQPEEEALREEVAVGLVLQLAEGEGVRPRVECAGEEAAGVDGEVVFGVGGGQPRLLEQH